MTALTEKIIELVPEIVVKASAFCHECKQYFTSESAKVGTQAFCPDDWCKSKNLNPILTKWEVICRPITLADVLRAMKYDEVISRHGVFGKEHNGDVIWSGVKWNLSTDLNGQSDETKAFLAKILGV